MMANATSTRDVIIQQIDELLLKLISQSEESLLITADGESLYVTGSDKGKSFLAENRHIAEDFHNFCYGTYLDHTKSNIFTKVKFAKRGVGFSSIGKPKCAKHAFTVFNMQAVSSDDDDEEGEETTQEFQQAKKKDFPVFNIQSQNYPGHGNSSRKPPGEKPLTGNTQKGNLNNMKSFKVEICQKNNKAQIKLSPLKGINEKSGGSLKKDTLRTSKSSDTAVNKSDDKAQDSPHMICSNSSHLGSSTPDSIIQGKSFDIANEESYVESPKITSPTKARFSERIHIDSKLSRSSSKESHSNESGEKDKSVCKKKDMNSDELMIGTKCNNTGPDEIRDGNPSDSNQCDGEEEETTLTISQVHVRENSELDKDGIKSVSRESDSAADISPSVNQEGIRNLNQKTSSPLASTIASKSTKEIAKKNSPGVKEREVGASASINKKNLKEVSLTDNSQLNLETPDSSAIVKHAQSHSFDKKSTEEAQSSAGDVQVKDTGSHSGEKQTSEDGKTPRKSNLAERCKEVTPGPAKTAADTSSTKGKDKLERGSGKRKRTQSAPRSPMKKRKKIPNSQTDQVSAVSTMDSLPGSEATESLNMLIDGQNIGVDLVKEMSKSPSKSLKNSPERKQSKEKLNEDPVASPKTKHELEKKQPLHGCKYDEKARNLKKTLIVKLEKIPNIQNYGKSVQKGSSLHHTTNIQKLNSMPSADLKKSRKQEKEYSEPLHPVVGNAITVKRKLHSRKHGVVTDQPVPDSLFPKVKNVDKTAAKSIQLNPEDVDHHETESIQLNPEDVDRHETESVQLNTKDVDHQETESIQLNTKDVDHQETESIQFNTKDVDHQETESIQFNPEDADLQETESIQFNPEDADLQETESPKQYTKDVDQPEKEFIKLSKKGVDKDVTESTQSSTESVDQPETECLKESVDKPVVESKKATLKKRREFSKKSEKRHIENIDDPAEMSIHENKFSSKPLSSNFTEKPQKILNIPTADSIGECTSSSKRCKLEKHIKPVLGKGIPDLKNFSLDLKTLSSQLQKLKKP